MWVSVEWKICFVYYESFKRELKTKPINECRCDERQANTGASMRLAYTPKPNCFFLKKTVVGGLREGMPGAWPEGQGADWVWVRATYDCAVSTTTGAVRSIVKSITQRMFLCAACTVQTPWLSDRHPGCLAPTCFYANSSCWFFLHAFTASTCCMQMADFFWLCESCQVVHCLHGST